MMPVEVGVRIGAKAGGNELENCYSGGEEMKKQISYIAPGQTAKALILVYLTFSVPIVLIGMLVAFIRYGALELSTIFSALILNAVIGFVLLWIACHAYNWVASRAGGIEITLADIPEEL
jgi:hypothetical protein